MSNCGNTQTYITGTVVINNTYDCTCTGSTSAASHQIVKTADLSVIGTMLVDDAELQFAAGAGDTWGLHFDLFTSSDSLIGNGRIYCAIQAPMDAVVSASCMVLGQDAGYTSYPTLQGPLYPTTQGTPSSPLGWGIEGLTVNPLYAWARISAQVVMGATAGTVGLQVSQISDVPSVPATVYAGSSLLATKAS